MNESAPLDSSREEAEVDYGPSQLAWIAVESSTGLPLHFVEALTPNGRWKMFTAHPGGGVEVAPGLSGAKMRAPGHRMQSGAKVDGVIVLDPDALLEVRVSGDARWLNFSLGGRREEHLQRFSAGQADNGTLLVAVDSLAVQSHPALANPIDIIGHLDSGWKVKVQWDVSAGARDIAILPYEVSTARETGILTVKPQGAIGIDVQWFIAPLLGFDPRTRTNIDNRLPLIRGSWGVAEFIPMAPASPPLSGEGNPNGEVDFPDVFMGVAYLVGACSADGKVLGRAVVTYDGEPVIVDLEEVGRRYRAWIVDGVNAKPVSEVDVQTEFRYGGSRCAEHACLWNTRAVANVAADGETTLKGVSLVPRDPLLPWPPPTEGILRVWAIGYHQIEVPVKWVPGVDGVCDIGVVSLHRRVPLLHFSGLEAPSDWLDEESLLAMPGQSFSVSLEMIANGQLAAWPSSRDAELGDGGFALLVRGFQMAGLEATGEVWVATRSKPFDITLESELAPGPGEYLAIGCSWRGIDRVLTRRSQPIDGHFEVMLRGPEGLELYVELRNRTQQASLARNSQALVPGKSSIRL